MKLPDIEEKGKPKRRPIPDHIPRTEVELSPGEDDCVRCGGHLRRIGEDVTEDQGEMTRREVAEVQKLPLQEQGLVDITSRSHSKLEVWLLSPRPPG